MKNLNATFDMKVLITSAVGKSLRILLIGSFKIFARILRIDGRVNTNLQLKKYFPSEEVNVL